MTFWGERCALNGRKNEQLERRANFGVGLAHELPRIRVVRKYEDRLEFNIMEDSCLSVAAFEGRV